MDRVAFTFFGLDIMWYGVLIAAGMLVGIVFVVLECRRIGFKEDTLIDMLIIAIPIGVICARLYYVAFSLDEFDSLSDVFNIRDGGLAIHGGIIGGVLTAITFCKFKKIDFLQVADIAIPSVAIAQAIGRWGNFFNQEVYGGPTNLPWGILIDGQKVHPLFLYESLGNLAIFFFLVWYRKNKRKNEGEVLALYLILYSVVRFFVEGMRVEEYILTFLGFPIAQLVSIGLIVAGVALLAYIKKINEMKI